MSEHDNTLLPELIATHQRAARFPPAEAAQVFFLGTACCWLQARYSSSTCNSTRRMKPSRSRPSSRCGARRRRRRGKRRRAEEAIGRAFDDERAKAVV